MEKLIILNIIISVAGAIIIIKFNRVRVKGLVQVLLDDIKIKQLEALDCFSRPALDFYNKAIQHPEKITIGGCVMKYNNEPIGVWIANGVDVVAFHTHDEKSEQRREELNDGLTYYDKLLLYKTFEAVRDGQIEMKLKLFV